MGFEILQWKIVSSIGSKICLEIIESNPNYYGSTAFRLLSSNCFKLHNLKKKKILNTNVEPHIYQLSAMFYPYEKKKSDNSIFFLYRHEHQPRGTTATIMCFVDNYCWGQLLFLREYVSRIFIQRRILQVTGYS